MSQQAWTCTVAELAQQTGGQLLSSPVASFTRVGTDSRADLAGQLFVPLKGENFDAHDFIPQAIERGARVVLVHEFREVWRPLLTKASFVQVADTLKGLQDLAHAWRKRHNFKVIGITGSNGKTSTKEFLFSVLRDYVSVHASKGSFNNHWGVPLSILEAGPEHTHLILEMGMNHAGEIRTLCQIAEPDIVTVTTVGRAHIGELGSPEAVAEAKEEIYKYSPKAVHVFNLDNEWTMTMQARSSSKQFVFSSFRQDVDVYLRALRMSWAGLELSGHIAKVNGQGWTQTLGRHNVVNLMAASTLALAAGLEPEQIWTALAKLKDSAWGRNQLLSLENGAKILFDGYNANPDSMAALMKNLYEMDVVGRKFLIVGDMRELGRFTDNAHQEVGERAAANGFAAVWFVGQNIAAFRRGFDKNKGESVLFHSEDCSPEISQKFLNLLGPDDLVAVKASRGVGLEKAFAAWPLATPLGKKP